MSRRNRRQIKSRPCTCDLFDVQVNFDDPNFRLVLITDLPLKTRIQVEIERDSKVYVWMTVNKDFPVVALENGKRGIEIINSIEELEADALNKYRYWKGRWPEKIDGIPGDELSIRVYLYPGNHKFGVCNRDLTGKPVVVKKDGHWISYETTITVPFPESIAKKLP